MSAPVPLGNFDWEPASWRKFPAAQQPPWPDAAEVESAVDELRRMPPLVFAGEARTLSESLATVAEGKGFLLHAGDCAESLAALSAANNSDKL
jgi:3-deoxy-7-phosphoheptulonate synthase